MTNSTKTSGRRIYNVQGSTDRQVYDYKEMATANVSGDPIEQFLCSLDLLIAGTNQLTFIAVLNSFLSVTAFLGNALILVAFRKESSLHPPNTCFVT